jgi:tRNA dimethylallyltransferase
VASIERDPPIVLIAGPTGVGKSALAIALAERFGGEIISADSRQVYRGLEIGTAQPSAEDRARVEHYLVAFLPPDQPFSAAMFVDHAEQALAEIANRGRVAFLVGGTHHYVRALLDRLQLPRVPPRWKVREELERLGREGRAQELHGRLARLDPAAAESIPASNVRRVVRALEVIEATDRPFSEIGRQQGKRREALRLALTMPRAQLYERVDARIDDMLARGWLDEVRELVAAGYSPRLPALTSTGYRELIRHVQGELPLDEAVRRVKYSTHAYVRRQYAWLRRDPLLEWLEQWPKLVETAEARVEAYLALTPGMRGEGQESGSRDGIGS